MSFRDLIESAIKGDAVSFNETFEKVMGEAVVSAVEDINEPVEIADVIETLLTLGVLSEEDLESEDFTEETLLELSKKTLGSYVRRAADQVQNNSDVAINNALNGRKTFDQRKTIDKRTTGIMKAAKKLTKEETEVVDEGKSYRRGDEKYSDIKKLKKGAANLRADRKNKRQVEEEVTEEAEQIDEISKKVLGSYIKKAANDKAKARGRWHNMASQPAYSHEDKRVAADHEDKRTEGIATAVKKLTGSAKVNAKD